MADKMYGGAPFGTQTARFDVSGVHPQNKMLGTYTEVPYCKRATTVKHLGPGTYTIETGDITSQAIDQKVRGSNWERAQRTSKLASMPHMLYRSQWEHEKELVKLLGPGKYNVKDNMYELNNRPSSNRGICQSGDSRLMKANKFRSTLPGPGTYGRGGVPWTALEEKNRESTSTVGMLCAGRQLYKTQTIGSNLPPGQYEHVNSIESLINKTVSTRGPYDLYTGERSKISKQLSQNRHLGPGKYELKSFIDKWNDHHYKKHGRFSTVPLCPDPPTERIYCNTLSQWPRGKDDPGPVHYEIKVGKERTMSAPCRYPFHSSTPRVDKRSQSGNVNPVGAGQYDINRCHANRHVNANRSVFVSGTPRLPPNVDSPSELLRNERIHPKGTQSANENHPHSIIYTSDSMEVS